MKIYDCDVTEVFPDYDVPEDIPEWEWIQEHATYAHMQNGEFGIWEFVMNISEPRKDIPLVLLRTFIAAYNEQCTYILFHQGT